MIVPAILTEKKSELVAMSKICASFTDYIQVDIMDGIFVTSRSVRVQDLNGWKPSLRFEAHLMVMDPLAWLDAFVASGAEKIIYHFEIKKDHHEIIGKIKKRGLRVGIAVNPATTNEEFKALVEKVDTILFLSVNPGFYGSEFIPEVLTKITSFKKMFPHKNVGIDGGIKLSNVLSVKRSGVDYICVGSAILKSDNPHQTYDNFVKLIHG